MKMKKASLIIACVALLVGGSIPPANAAPFSGYHEYQSPSITVQETLTHGVKGKRFSDKAAAGSIYGGGGWLDSAQTTIGMETYYEKDMITTCHQNWVWNGLFNVKDGKTCSTRWAGTYSVYRGDAATLGIDYRAKSFNISIATDNPKTDKVEIYSGWYNPAPNKKAYIKSDLVVTKIGKNSARISNITANKSKLFFTFVVKDMKGTKRYLYEIKSVWPDPTISSIKIDGKDCSNSCSFDISRDQLLETHTQQSFNKNKPFPSEYDERGFQTKNYSIDIVLGGNYLKNPTFSCGNSTNGNVDSSSGSIKFNYLNQYYWKESETIKGTVVDNGHTYYTDVMYLKRSYWSKPRDTIYTQPTTINCSVSGYKPTGKHTKRWFEVSKDIQITFNNLDDFESDGDICIVDAWRDETKPSIMNYNDKPCTSEEMALIPRQG